MKKVMLSLVIIVASVLLLTTVGMADLLSLNKPVSGTNFSDRGDIETFPFSNINDGDFDDSFNLGATFPNQWSFWLTQDSKGTGAYVTIDLEGLYSIESFLVQDTHNRGFNDRGTNEFRIQISTDNSTFTDVVDDAFTDSEWRNLTIKTYDITPAMARYVRFYVDSTYGVRDSAGLNELEVYGSAASAVPLPGAVWLLGSGLLGLAGLGRRKFRKS